MKIPKGEPTPNQFRKARQRSGLTQREASRVIFGADTYRTVQNWEMGNRPVPKGLFVLFLLMTDQATIEDAKQAAQVESK